MSKLLVWVDGPLPERPELPAWADRVAALDAQP